MEDLRGGVGGSPTMEDLLGESFGGRPTGVFCPRGVLPPESCCEERNVERFLGVVSSCLDGECCWSRGVRCSPLGERGDLGGE